MGRLYQTTLERVRLRGARVEAPVARLRLSHLLASASLQPPAMPPSALLLVRAMSDPLPGRITRAFTPGALASAEWERAAQERLAAFYGSAARPMWGPAPSAAAAVLFSDYGEMLACLARDLAAGAAVGWWWQVLLRGHLRPLPGSWAAVWEKEPLYIPAALDSLERRQQAVKVLERIAPVQAWNLLKAVLSAFDLAGLVPARIPSAGWTVEPKPHATGREAQAGDASVNLAIETEEGFDPHAGALANTSFPWEPHISQNSLPAELGYERQALLGIGLLLRRAPQVAFSSAFALRFRAWVREEETRGRARAAASSTADSSPPDFLSGPAQSRAIRGETSPSYWRSRLTEKDSIPAGMASRANLLSGREKDRESGTREKGRTSALRPFASAESFLPFAPAENREPAVEDHGAAPSTHSLTPAEGTLPARMEPGPASAQWRHSAPDKTISERARPPQSLQERMEAAPAEPLPSITARQWEGGELTSAGGILYLVHFLRQAGLLREFETGLGGWALLELVARCLLDDAPHLADDAIWAALAHLDDRDPRTPPGLSFKPQPTYEAPASWLANATDQPRFVRFRSRGLEIWNAEGFLIFDSERHVPRPAGWRRLSFSRRRKLRRAARVRPLSLSLSPELRRFLHFVLPYARWRLERALGSSRAGPFEEALLPSGRLYLTSTHVDLVMPMQEISVPVRLAGLDANPGWVPELGRVVTFHFL